MKVKHTFYKTVLTGEDGQGKKREPFVEEVEVPDGSRFHHLRAPLMIRQYIGNKDIVPAVVPELASQTGGATILISPHDDKYVAVRVAWCRYTDAYCRSLGRYTAASKEPSLVLRTELEEELHAIDEQMLASCAYPLRNDPELMKDCYHDWKRSVERFTKVDQQKVVHVG